MASIVTRKSSFAVVYMTTVNGGRKQKWETYHTLPEAVRRKEQLELYHDLRKSKKIGGEVETVAQLMSVYLRLHGVPRWSPSTYQSNCGLIQHYILPCMGDMRLSELSPRTVAALYSQTLEEPRISSPYHKQSGQKLSPTTLRSIHKVLHSAFEQAVLWEYVDRNPFHRASLPACRPKQKAFLTPEQIKQLVLHCPPTLALAIHLTFAASLRKGELLALTWQDIDLKEQRLTVRRSIRYNSARHRTEIGTTKRKKIRSVDFCNTLAEILKEAKKAQMLDRLACGPLYSQNYYLSIEEKNRTYYEVYSLPVSEHPPEGYQAISLVCVRQDGRYESPATVSNVCQVAKKRVDGMESFHFHQRASSAFISTSFATPSPAICCPTAQRRRTCRSFLVIRM